jgi:hypothetical protein
MTWTMDMGMDTATEIDTDTYIDTDRDMNTDTDTLHEQL